jgi:MFS family permease
MSPSSLRRRLILTLGPTQILSWGALYYAIAIVAPDIAAEMHWRPELVFGAFSWCLLVAGLVATPAGIWLDRYGGRTVMSAGSLVCGAGLILLSQAHGLATYYGAWTLLGVAMALILYEAAFATLNREIAQDARRAISTMTLFGGFASTVFWPLTLYFKNHIGWRDTYLLYGAIQLLVCLPAHATLPARSHRSAPPAHAVSSHTLAEALRLRRRSGRRGSPPRPGTPRPGCS